MSKRDPFIAVDTLDIGGKPMRIYPMILGDAAVVEGLIQRFSLDSIPVAMLMENSRQAVVEIVKLATKKTEDELQAVTVYEIEQIVDTYLGLSKLKKKMEA